MKTLLAALEYPPAVGGVETYYAHLASQWPEEIKVLDNSNKQLSGGLWRWLPGLLTLYKNIKAQGTEWLIVGEILPLGTITWLLSFLLPFKYCVVRHGLDYSLARRSPRKRWMSTVILKKASAIIAVNSYTAGLIQKNVPLSSAKLIVVNPGAEPAPAASPLLVRRFEDNYNLDNAFVLMTMARLVKRKGVDMVLRAIARLRTSIPDLRYVIIGQGPDKNYIQAIIDEQGIGEHVVMLPTVRTDEKAAWLELADVVIMPARNIDGDYEGFGIIYLDAGTYAKPVIAGQSGGVSDAVTDGINGLIVDEENPEAIATAIKRLYEDVALRQRLGESGLQRAEALTWQRQIEKIYLFLKTKAAL